jgi:hypothetical protein
MDLLQCIKITTIIGQEINMKRDLYRFAKARKYGERITLWEDEWYNKYNKEYYKQNKTIVG